MKNFIKRKDFEKTFATHNKRNIQIWVISRIKELPPEIIHMTLKLAELECIHYIRICDETLSASSENYPNRPKVSITHMSHPTAIGVKILYSIQYKTIDFFDINSPIKGNGSKMVDATLNNFPKDWQPSIIMGFSDGFWKRMVKKYRHLDWIT